MRWTTIALGFLGLAIFLAPPAYARSSHGGNCVAYAREVTGIQLDGNAAAWWPNAEGRYERGQQPKVGAILVFKPHGGMRVGHVAVVARIVGPREILVDQANWIRGRVVTAMSVVDASAANDWTSVKVIELHSGTHGRENPTYGFIYPHSPPAHLGEAVAQVETSAPHHQRIPVAHAARAPEMAQTVPLARHQPAIMQGDFHLPSDNLKLARSSGSKFSHAAGKQDHQQVAVLY